MTKLAWTSYDGLAPPASTSTGTWPRITTSQADDDRLNRDVGVRQLYELRHADMVRFAVFLTGDVHVAEDIAHEAFVRIFETWDRIDDPERTDAYLRATIVNLVRGGHRRRRVVSRQPGPHFALVGSAEDHHTEFRGQMRMMSDN